MTITDNINPSHYRSHESGIEIIYITERQNFCDGNATKYICRAGKKNDEIEDLEKAKWYLLRELNSSRTGGTDAIGYKISERYLESEPVEDIKTILRSIFVYSFKRLPRTQNPLVSAIIDLEKYIEKRKTIT